MQRRLLIKWSLIRRHEKGWWGDAFNLSLKSRYPNLYGGNRRAKKVFSSLNVLETSNSGYAWMHAWQGSHCIWSLSLFLFSHSLIAFSALSLHLYYLCDPFSLHFCSFFCFSLPRFAHFASLLSPWSLVTRLWVMLWLVALVGLFFFFLVGSPLSRCPFPLPPAARRCAHAE